MNNLGIYKDVMLPKMIKEYVKIILRRMIHLIGKLSSGKIPQVISQNISNNTSRKYSMLYQANIS